MKLVDEVWQLFDKHGFEISHFASFGKEVPDEAFEEIYKLNAIS